MGSVFVKAIGAVLVKMIATLGSVKLVEYVLFGLLDALVKSTKTDADDKFLAKFKEAYYSPKKD